MKLKQKVKISTLAIDEGDDTIHYQLEVTNGINSTTQDFYGYADNFKEFANGLLSFPKNITDKVKYELGESGERWAYYILLDVFCYEIMDTQQSILLLTTMENYPKPTKVNFISQLFQLLLINSDNYFLNGILQKKKKSHG